MCHPHFQRRKKSLFEYVSMNVGDKCEGFTLWLLHVYICIIKALGEQQGSLCIRWFCLYVLLGCW